MVWKCEWDNSQCVQQLEPTGNSITQLVASSIEVV